MREHLVTIEKMSFGGAGIGHIEGKVCFVPFTAVGDTVRIKVKSEKKSYIEGQILEIIDHSPSRVRPPCPVFGRCGGCDFQHIDYHAQLKCKEDIFAEVLWRTGRVERTKIEAVIAAPESYRYRSRVQLKMRHAEGENHLGFYISGSHYIIDIPGVCAISRDPINTTYNELCNLLNGFPEPDKIPQIDLSAGEDGKVISIFHYIGERSNNTIDFLRKNGRMLSHVEGLFLQSGRKSTMVNVYGTEHISYTISDPLDPACFMNFHTSRGGFSQVNYDQNRALVAAALKWAQPTSTDRVLDLYCGNGNFSLPFAKHADQVLAFEDYEQSIRDAEYNRGNNNITNAVFESIDVVEGLRRLISEKEAFDIVVLDPPRTGAADAVKLIPSLNPQKIIYISCDPPTLARDIAYLKKLQYDVIKIRPVDMFPQTYHIESITLLEKI